MQVRFKDKKLRELCEKQAVAEKKLGAASARKLKVRLVALEAATCVTDLVAGNPHPLKGDRLGQFALDLAGGWFLPPLTTLVLHALMAVSNGPWSRLLALNI